MTLPTFARVEEELQQARLYANNVSGRRHGLRERIAAAEKTLWEIDSDYRAEQEREVAERLARETASAIPSSTRLSRP